MKNSKIYIIFLSLIIISSFLGGFVGFIFGNYSPGLADKVPFLAPDSEKKITIEREDFVQKDSVIIDTVEKTSPAVVSIIVTKDIPRMRNFFNDPFGFDFFMDPFGGRDEGESETQKIGGGSGFFVSDDGMIMTNKHVVDDNEAGYTVIGNDGEEYEASVIAKHPTLDLAIIKIEGNNFPILEIGNSDDLKVGQSVIAIGNSLGEFSNSVSLGIVSGLKRSLVAGSGFGQSERLSNIIQTDAAINPGNSGGPLLDIHGRVVGINVAIAQGAENIGFAIPSNQMKNMIEQVKFSGKISVPFLGVRYVPVNKDIQEANNLPFDHGVIVIRGERVSDLAVVPGSPADKAGILENDIILEIEGVKLDDENQLADIISTYNVGDEVVLKVWSKGETKDVKVKLEERK